MIEKTVYEAGFNELRRIDGFPENILAEFEISRSFETSMRRKQVNCVTLNLQNDKYFLEIDYGFLEKKKSSVELHQEEKDAILELMEKVKPEEPKKLTMGLDGTSFYLTVKDSGENSAWKYCWWGWNNAGKSWKNVRKLAEYFWNLAEEKL